MMLMWMIPLVFLFLLVDRPRDRRTARSWAPFVLVLLALPVMGMSFMMGGFGRFMGWGMHGYTGGGYTWGWTGWIGGLVMLIGLGAALYLAFRKSGTAQPDSEELQILRLRLARGEISAEEYDLLRQKLNG